VSTDGRETRKVAPRCESFDRAVVDDGMTDFGLVENCSDLSCVQHRRHRDHASPEHASPEHAKPGCEQHCAVASAQQNAVTRDEPFLLDK